MTATATNATACEGFPAVPDGWRVTPEGTVRVSDVARSAGDYQAVNYTVRACGVPVAAQCGQGSARYIPLGEALLILAAATLAVTAGIAIASMYRAMKGSGASIEGGQVTIPLGAVA